MYIDDIYTVFNMLEDELSKKIYNNKFLYRLTGDIKYIREIVSGSCPELLPIAEDIFRDTFEKINTDHGVILYGAGKRSALLESVWKRYLQGHVIGFCDSDKNKWGKNWLGEQVFSPDEIMKNPDASIVVLGSNYEAEIIESLLQRGVMKDRIYTVPFADVVSDDQYFAPDIVELLDGEEVFLDVGCYNLETSLELLKRCSPRHIYAFEPDKYNFAACNKIIEDKKLKDITMLQYGVSDRDGKIQFASMGESYSRAAAGGLFEGTDIIPVGRIDTLIPKDEKVTFIKMDIEGMELSALYGAKEIIQRDRPKLAICIYHKLEDLTEIPLYIRSIVPDYRFYIRHYSNESVETVLYAVL